jgi:altronate dehydratase large subunit
MPGKVSKVQFLGYERAGGMVGIRNHVVVIPAGKCANEMAARIADGVKGAVPLLHNQPCIHLKPDNEMAKRVLIGLGANPNAAAALVVGVGCDSLPASELAQGIALSGKPVEYLTIDKEGSYEAVIGKGVAIVRDMVEKAALLQRRPCHVASLLLALKCGGSDATSALACNPANGWAADTIIANGGAAIFSETAEIIGAEHIVARRAANERVARRIFEVVARMDKRITSAGVDIRGSEPTPGNIRGGLTTLEEKSLGAIAKSGTSPICDVLEYGEKPQGKGLFFMDSSANTPQMVLALAAAGAQLMTFGFGGGLPARFRGLPALSGGELPLLPVIKILGNPKDVSEKDYFDVYVGDIIEGKQSLKEAGEQIIAEILSVASGKPTRTEVFPRSYREVMEIYHTGPTL